MKCICLEECGTLSAELFAKLEELARRLRGNNQFFGGIRLLFVGDFKQLAPCDDVIQDSSELNEYGQPSVRKKKQDYFFVGECSSTYNVYMVCLFVIIIMGLLMTFCYVMQGIAIAAASFSASLSLHLGGIEMTTRCLSCWTSLERLSSSLLRVALQPVVGLHVCGSL